MLLKFVLFALVVASVSAASPRGFMGSDHCTWGPSYWCQNYKQAKECKAMDHCRENVWNMKDGECDVCKEVVDTLREVLSQQGTEDEVIAFLEQACETYGGSLAAECKALVDQYGPELFKELLAMLNDSQQVCTELGMCSSKDKGVIMAKLISQALPLKKVGLGSLMMPGPVILAPKPKVVQRKGIRASVKCVICEFAMNELESLLKENSTKAEIEAALEKVCSLLPSTVVDECNQFIAQYFDAIVELLVQELDPKKVCTALGLCADEEHRQAMMKPVKLVPGSNETCEICKTVMTYLQSLLKDNSTDEEIINLLKTICNYLPAQVASECNAIVDEYGMVILQLIADTPPDTLCMEIGLCQSGLKKQKDLCFLGASYWCATKENAAKCNVYDHCEKHVWN